MDTAIIVTITVQPVMVLIRTPAPNATMDGI